MRVGIIGGGQLGFMLIKYGLRKLKPDLDITVLDPAGDQCCCAQLANVKIIQGDLYSHNKLCELIDECDVVTAEIEHFKSDLVADCFTPSLGTFSIINNKATQKKFLASKNIPVVEYALWNCEDPWTFKGNYSGRYVVKCTTGGYDGHGVFFIDNPTPDTILCNANGLTLSQLANKMPDKTVVIEEYIHPAESLEVSVIVAIDYNNNTVHYEPVVMSFHSERNILDRVTSSGLPGEARDRLINVKSQKKNDFSSFNGVAIQTAKLFRPGLFAVEMFYVPVSKHVYVNEVAPRVHNSGHHTIESCDISQFEMASRIVLGLPITQPKQLFPLFEMSNVLGTFDGGPYLISLHTGIPPHNVFVHDYGKKMSKKWRKLGHVTSVSDSHLLTTTRSLARTIKPENRPLIGIVMGSETDSTIMCKAADMLRVLDIPFEETVVSAHRTPERLRMYAQTALERGLQIVIAGAGGAAHLPGMIAAFAPGLPVVGVPLNRNSLSGQDALMSIVQMPTGVPVACMAIDGAANAALFAAMTIPAFRHRVNKYQLEAQARVENSLAK